MLIIETLGLFFIFTLLVLLTVYSPGFLILSFIKEDLKKQETLALSFVLGIILFVLVAVVFGLTNMRFLVLPLILMASIFSVIKFKSKLISPWSLFLKNKLLILIILAGILIQGFINFPSGFLYTDGLNFWSSQGHDGLWHVASMEEITKSFPPQNPAFSGEVLYNYHYLVDIVMGEFYRIFPFFSALDLYFRFFPVLFSFMIGVSVFSFVTKWQNNEKIGYIALFFIYGVGSFGYIVSVIKGGSIFSGETLFWAAQQNTILGNPPHAISHSILPAFLLSFLYYIQNKKKQWLLASFIIGSMLVGFKVSGAVVMLVGLGLAAGAEFLFYRRFSLLVLTAALAFSNIVTFKLMTRGGSSLLMFLPWWFVRTTIVDRLGWMDLEFQRQHYLSKGTWHAYLRVIQLEFSAFLIFLIGNMGTRFISFFEIGKRLISDRKSFYKNSIEILLIGIMLTGLAVPLLFVQKGLIYNNIQFMQYFLLISGFYAAVFIYRLTTYFKNYLFRILIFTVLVIFSVPTVIGNLTELYGPNTSPLAQVSRLELNALKYLKDNSGSEEVVLNFPFDKNLKSNYKQPPLPIYAWYDTPYIPALSSRRTYLSSEQLTLLNYPDVSKRQNNIRKFFEQDDFFWNKEFLKEANITYIYINKPEIKKQIDLQNNNLKLFFENGEVIIYKVNKV